MNIGFVLYSKGNVPGTLNARWSYQNIYGGKGLATGGPKDGFAGHYHVRYYDEQGKFSDEYDLIIEKAGAFYNASWLTNGKLSAGVSVWRLKMVWPSAGAGSPTNRNIRS